MAPTGSTVPASLRAVGDTDAVVPTLFCSLGPVNEPSNPIPGDVGGHTDDECGSARSESCWGEMEDIGDDEVADWGNSIHPMSSARVVRARHALSYDAVRAEPATSPSMWEDAQPLSSMRERFSQSSTCVRVGEQVMTQGESGAQFSLHHRASRSTCHDDSGRPRSRRRLELIGTQEQSEVVSSRDGDQVAVERAWKLFALVSMMLLCRLQGTGTVEETSWQPDAIGSREGVGVSWWSPR